jgi:small-conductance mechanosensitive channel
MDRYLSLKFWFISGPIMPKTAIIIFSFFVIMIVVGIVASVNTNKKKKTLDSLAKKLMSKVIAFLITMGVIGVVLSAFFYQGAYILSMKFWFLLWLLISIIWIIIIGKYYLKIGPRRDEISRQKKFEKYLK